MKKRVVIYINLLACEKECRTRVVLSQFTGHIIPFTSKAFRHVGFQDETAKYCSQRQRKVAFGSQRDVTVSCSEITKLDAPNISVPFYILIFIVFIARYTYSATRGIAIVSRPSVCPSVCDVDVPWACVSG